jgi:predicted double-glycine peptidase
MLMTCLVRWLNIIGFWLCLVCTFQAHADFYQWTDVSGKTHFSDQKPAETIEAKRRTLSQQASDSVRLNVPLVKQGKMLCGPATIEMLLRYWGVDEYDQYDIAYNMLLQFADTKRVMQSGILIKSPVNWELYPGTGTLTMRGFLKRFAATANPKLKELPVSTLQAAQEQDRLFTELKHYISQGIPVIVHQYWGQGSKGHYRLVTGYDDNRKEVYLNDAAHGKATVQAYQRFLELWNVDEPWLHYNSIVFNTNKGKLRINMNKYSTDN